MPLLRFSPRSPFVDSEILTHLLQYIIKIADLHDVQSFDIYVLNWMGMLMSLLYRETFIV